MPNAVAMLVAMATKSFHRKLANSFLFILILSLPCLTSFSFSHSPLRGRGLRRHTPLSALPVPFVFPYMDCVRYACASPSYA